MKYGLRERISGAVIIIALAVIFVPMLFDEPTPREERPAPVLTIEQPIDVRRTPVDEPQPPASLSEPAVDNDAPEIDVEQIVLATEPVVRDEPGDLDEPTPVDPEPEADPIAELAQAAQVPGVAEQSAPETSQTPAPSVATASSGEWAVQVGSFGEAANAERLEAQLNEQGFSAYRRDRGNDMTSVYVGPYASSDDGERARTELKERANIQGLLVRVREAE